MGTILKVFIELVTIFLLLLMLCLVTLSCPTLRDPVDCSLPGSSVHGIPQARILQWIAMCSSRGSSQPRYQTQGSPTAGRFFTIWATREAHEYCRGEAIPSPGDLPNPGIKSGSRALSVDSLPEFCCLCFGFFGLKACGIFTTQPGIKPAPPVLEGSLNH